MLCCAPKEDSADSKQCPNRSAWSGGWKEAAASARDYRGMCCSTGIPGRKKKRRGSEELLCSRVRQLSGSCDPTVSYWALRGRRENKSSAVIHELPCQLLAQDALKVREPPGGAPKQASAPLGSSPRLEAC